MKSWIQKWLYKLENYSSVSKESRNLNDIWLSAYIIFLSFYIGFWIDYQNPNQIICIISLIAIIPLSFTQNSVIFRTKFATLFTFFNPVLFSILISIDNKYLRIGIILLFFTVLFFFQKRRFLELTKILIVVNVIFCLYLIPKYYYTKFKFSKKQNPSIAKLITPDDQHKDIFIILLDGFPSNEVLKNYFNLQSKFTIELKNKGFKEFPSVSKYLYTDQSLPNIFSGIEFAGASSAYRLKDLNKMKSFLPGEYLKNFSENYHYILHFNSLLIDKNNNHTKSYFGRGADFNVYAFSLVDRILIKIFKKENQENIEVSYMINQVFKALNNDLQHQNKQLNFYHFLTFHTLHYDSSYHDQIKSQLLSADRIGIKAVNMILKYKPNAKIVVLSDHGIRPPLIEEKDSNKGILYIKN